MIGTFAQEQALHLTAQREEYRERYARVAGTAAVVPPRFTYRYLRDEARLFKVYGVRWTDNETNETKDFEYGDYAGAAEWQREQGRRS